MTEYAVTTKDGHTWLFYSRERAEAFARANPGCVKGYK